MCVLLRVKSIGLVLLSDTPLMKGTSGVLSVEDYCSMNPCKMGFGDSCGIRKNEALDFQWCTLSEFRTNEHIGFSQERVIEMCLERFEGLNKLR